MAGNTRGRLKEKFEGVHRNFEWSKHHLGDSLILIKDHNPKLSESIASLLQGIKTLDELALQIYTRL